MATAFFSRRASTPRRIGSEHAETAPAGSRVTCTRVWSGAVSGLILTVGIAALVGSLAWRGKTFPGFFLLPNRVVPSIGLPGWSGVGEGRAPYQMVLLAVDGTAVASADDAYRAAARHRVGDPVGYRLARAGRVETRVFALHQLTALDHLAIFGLYFLSGAAYLALGVLAGARWREGEPYRGLAAFGWTGALFCFTAMDIYGAGRLFRLHALAETLLIPTTAHLAVACPRDLLAGRPTLRGLLYAVGLVVGGIYQMFLYAPVEYAIVHNFCQAGAALLAFPLAVRLALAVDAEAGAAAPAGMRALLAGTVLGMLVPAVVFGLSGATGGMLPVNTIAAFPMFFPLLSLPMVQRWRAMAPAAASTPGRPLAA